MNPAENRTDTIFHFQSLRSPDFGLVLSSGPDLGNLLFPISCALIGQALHGGRFVYLTMRQIKIGTFLRGECDKLTYDNVLRGWAGCPRYGTGTIMEGACSRICGSWANWSEAQAGIWKIWLPGTLA